MQSSGNPALSDKNVKRVAKDIAGGGVMTINGTLTKVAWLLAVLFGVGVWSWGYTQANPDNALWLVIGSAIAALIVGMVVIFKSPSPFLVSLYAGLEGIVLGAISFLFNDSYQGIVAQAIILTLGVTLSMFLLYALRVVRVTEKLRSVILIATVGVLFFYVISWIIGLFSQSFNELIYSGSSGVFISGLIVIIAAFNLLLDFDFIERGSKAKLPKKMEWYGGFGLMVTLIWLYISILRMLGASRN